MDIKLKDNSILLIDAMNLMHRSYYAYPNLKSNNGEPTGAFYGFVNYIKSFVDKFNPGHIVVCSDAHRYCFRNDIFPEYKGTRKETPEDLKPQFALMERYLELANIKFVKQNGYEADDLIGSLAKKAKEYKYNTYIISGDTDLFQLINTEVYQLYVSSKGLIYYDIEAVKEKYQGLTPNQLLDFKALKGDTSDNVPGVAGIGDKTAIKLLTKYQGLDGIYENINQLKGKQKENISTGRDLAYLSKKLVTIKCDIELNYNDLLNPNNFNIFSEEVISFLRSLNIKRFSK